MRKLRQTMLVSCTVLFLTSVLWQQTVPASSQLDASLTTVLKKNHFTGRVQSSLRRRLGRDLNVELANLGRLLWFDTITGLNNDNTCGGCHSPINGFGDTQSIAIGIDNNGVVGPERRGPRNMRRTPTAANTAFFPNLMWNSRFSSLSANPFDNSSGLQFPAPEGLTLSYLPHLLVAQAFIPPTERTEVAGFEFRGDNDAIRAEVLRRLNSTPAYRTLFGNVFPQVATGAPINFDMFGMAIAEFEFSLIFADAPLDRFARGDRHAMTTAQKRGALLFFGSAGCVSCHAVAGRSNEMFSDFDDHVAGTPQIVPRVTNNNFDGSAANEDFGREEITGDPEDRYKFRTSPLRNLTLQSAFFHNGAFSRLDDALRYHLNPREQAKHYSSAQQHLDDDLLGPTGPIEPVLQRLDPRFKRATSLTSNEFNDLLAFLGNGLLDSRALPKNLRSLVPPSVPSGRPVLQFQFNEKKRRTR
jgi:cytochrome c peroxidase